MNGHLQSFFKLSSFRLHPSAFILLFYPAATVSAFLMASSIVPTM